MKRKSTPSVFGCLLLGLIQVRSQSGYAVRQALKIMPITHYTDSPGSVYPALKKLERTGFILGKTEGQALRPRRVYSITEAGKRALKNWLTSPLERDEFLRRSESLFVRLSFSNKCLGDNELASLVMSVLTMAESLRAELLGFHQSAGPMMEKGGNMATEMALEILAAHIRWSKKALNNP